MPFDCSRECCYGYWCTDSCAPVLSSLGCIPKSGITGDRAVYLLETPPDCFHSSCTILHSHQQKVRVPVPPYSHQHLLFSINFLSPFILVAVSGMLLWFCFGLHFSFLVAQTVKNLPTRQETQVPSQIRKDTLEKEMATRSGIPAWKIPWTEEPGGLQSLGLQRVRHD